MRGKVWDADLSVKAVIVCLVAVKTPLGPAAPLALCVRGRVPEALIVGRRPNSRRGALLVLALGEAGCSCCRRTSGAQVLLKLIRCGRRFPKIAPALLVMSSRNEAPY